MSITFVSKLTLYTFFASIFIYLLSFLGFLNPRVEIFGFFLIIATLIGLSFWKIEYGLLFLAFEFLAGIDGHLFEFKSLSIRFVLFAIFMLVWLIQKLQNYQSLKLQINPAPFCQKITPYRKIILNHSSQQQTTEYYERCWIKNFTKSFFFKPFAFTLFFITLAGIIGIIRGNSFNLIFADLVCYSYLLLIFPFFDLISNSKKYWIEKIFQIFSGAIVATSTLTMTTLYLFASHSAVHGGIYYQWFREYVIGKVATMNNNFFRVVMSADILTLIFFLIIVSILFFTPHLIKPQLFRVSIKDALKNFFHKKLCTLARGKGFNLKNFHQLADKKYLANTQLPWLIFLGILSSIALTISFTRNFFLGFIISFIFLCLILKIPLKRKIIFSGCLIVIFLLESFLIFYLCNHKNIQTNFLFLNDRIETIFNPETEASSITRLERLNASFKKLKEHPILGSGLGSEIVAYDYAIKKIIKTPHIDWGYLENWIDLGLFGFLSYFWFLGILFWRGVKKIYYSINNCDFYLGILIGLFCLFAIHLFGPFLFYPTGIFYILLCLMIFI
ncbi:O-antigen ligase family protein [Candidatus Kuenenbacteria bacterium]|nr:O-antigen ligase family protein [Candidatus Kuenenbacteria bacterium]